MTQQVKNSDFGLITYFNVASNLLSELIIYAIRGSAQQCVIKASF